MIQAYKINVPLHEHHVVLTSHRFIYAYFSDKYLSFLSGKMSDNKDLDAFLHVFESWRYDHKKPKDHVEEAAQLLALIS